MGNKTSKKPKDVNRQTGEEQGDAKNNRTVRAANQSAPVDSDGRKVFLPFSDDPDILVYFGVRVHEVNNRFVLIHVRENGLAYAAGFRSGDKLIAVNSADIDTLTLVDLLRYFLEYDEPQKLIGVERDGTLKTFIWVIFKIVMRKDCYPAVVVLQTLENDENIGPSIKIYNFLRRVNNPVNIYIDGNPPLYLTIGNDEKLTFQTYDANGSVFYEYLYSDLSKKPRGELVAFSLEKLDADDSDSYSCSDTAPSTDEGPSEETELDITSDHERINDKKSCPASTKDKIVKVENFPKLMTGTRILANPRFWFQNAFEGEMSLQSMRAEGFFLGIGDKGEAVLKTTPTKLWLNIDKITLLKSML